MVTTNPAQRAATAGDDHRMRRDIGTIGLLFTAIGSVIGSGWLFGALNAAEIAGPASLASWAIGGVMIVLIGLCYAEIGVMFPHSGGVVRYPHYAFGSFASFTTGWITWLAAASVAPIEVEAALQYATNYLPWLTTLSADQVPVLTPAGYAVAAALLFVFCVINLYGVRWFARVNTAIVWWKLFIIVLVVVVFLVLSFNAGHLSSAGGFAPYGAHGVFSAIATGGIAFSYFGFRQGVELAGETRNPQRNIPITLIGSVLICGVIYIALQLAFLGAVPDDSLRQGWSQVGTNFTSDTNVLAQFGPLAAIAGVLGATWLAVLLYIDAVDFARGHRPHLHHGDRTAVLRDGPQPQRTLGARHRQHARRAMGLHRARLHRGSDLLLAVPRAGSSWSASSPRRPCCRSGPGRSCWSRCASSCPIGGAASSSAVGCSCRSWRSGRRT